MELFGIVAMLSSMIFVSLGLLKQALRNHARRSCEGSEPLTVALLLAVYFSWSLYALTKPGRPDWLMAVPMMLGATMSGMLAAQYVYYTHLHHPIEVKSPHVRQAVRALVRTFHNDGVFLKRVTEYSADGLCATGQFVVPKAHSYTFLPIRYVSASEKLACVVHIAFVLVCALAAERHLPGSAREYEELLQRNLLRLKYARLDFERHIPKSQAFTISARLPVAVDDGMTAIQVLLSGEVSGEIGLICAARPGDIGEAAFAGLAARLDGHLDLRGADDPAVEGIAR